MYSYTLEMNDEKLPVLVREKRMVGRNAKHDNPEIIVKLFNENYNLSNKAEEHCYMISLDSKCHVQGIFELSHGTVNNSLLSPREIMIRGLLTGASNIILIHNHPSGDPTPSNDDFTTTERIKQAGQLINIPLIDHIIVGNGDYYSFKRANMI